LEALKWTPAVYLFQPLRYLYQRHPQTLCLQLSEKPTSDPFIQKRSPLHKESSYPSPFLEPEQCPDPTTRAALSLPHLAKVTTPYGFVTLSQSPQMVNEEALLFQAGLRRLHKDEDSVHHRTRAIHIKHNASRRSSTVQHLSREYSISQTEAGGDTANHLPSIILILHRLTETCHRSQTSMSAVGSSTQTLHDSGD
jgi:hypothetical protein